MFVTNKVKCSGCKFFIDIPDEEGWCDTDVCVKKDVEPVNQPEPVKETVKEPATDTFTDVVRYVTLERAKKKLEKNVSVLQKQLSDMEAESATISGSIDKEHLITSKSIKEINKMMAVPHTVNGFSVLSTKLTKKGNLIDVSINFSQPIFTGWKTETPYLSYQSCKWSIDTPEKPSENHVPQYIVDCSYSYDLVYWDFKDGTLTLLVMTSPGVSATLVFKDVKDAKNNTLSSVPN
jgi:hypothetical protein